MTPAQKEWTCNSAQAAYGAYQAVIAAGHKPSKEEVLAAAGASAFLRLWCGWTTTVGAGVRMAGPSSDVDENFIPFLVPPQKD